MTALQQIGAPAFELYDLLGIDSDTPITVRGLALDNRQVEPGFAFVALDGASTHGLDHVRAAVSAGAVAVLIDAADRDRATSLSLPIPIVAVLDLHTKLPELARAVWGNVDQLVSLCGITGTDGKTSTALFLAQLLHTRQSACAVLGTVGNGFLGQLEPSSHTTSDVLAIYRSIAELAQRGAERVVMEVSSHALDQRRVADLSFEVGALTNIGRDHLDYHGTVECYAEAKRKLFTEHAKQSVLNLDDARGREWFSRQASAVGYSVNGHADARWRGEVLSLDEQGMHCRICVGKGAAIDCDLNVIGRFNLSNILCACAMAESLGICVEDILSRLTQITPVVGRLECIRVTGRPLVVIDYAHTEQALSSAIAALREHVAGTLWCVFGCGGNRDKGKRAGMARVACAAERVVLTTDNPRFEAPEDIIQDARLGLITGHPADILVDRKAAIEFALDNAALEDCILIAGKGHEAYQEIEGRQIAFSDHAVVRERFRDGA